MLGIGELATKTGLTAHTIRFYEKSGLINASQRRSLVTVTIQIQMSAKQSS